ncbi:NAD(P)/FAD-dependent oxidoreductase [Nocardia sp. CDC159]|uniref:NAD(P)/FAD-dependent oxidoreductase n=1 Tax=Nocardia pulmonis TaxID=2951408 RepID=A0A9X2E6A1_9NOCA|nr:MULTISPECIES: NAD(P)/FAD-dependent oxidoreductase [Nocardia]MCM6774440.1 NAD(P)/FAD-dependent oxidoreductase [Nocardia pulmonis]MCM6787494.1 NAD(P)/FAD-dependent oxidoreductase [Nocardia sp. CDC159]
MTLHVASQDQRPSLAAELDTAIVIIGAGFGGIGMGVALRNAGTTNFIITEEADQLGGVWRDNTYPGCACDVPSHLYSFSFAPYRDTRQRYPGQRQILEYLDCVAHDHKLERHLHCRTAITEATYRDDLCRWDLTTGSGGRIRADILIFAAGQLHRPHVPAIAGMAGFTGTITHTADWDHTQDLRGCDVAVIGTGSSAAQLLPHLAAVARKVSVYQRTPHWVLPKPAAEFGPATRALLHLPGGHHLYRQAVRWGSDLVLAPIMHRGWSARPAEWLARTHLRRSITDPALRAALTPHYPIGAKRIIFDSHFYSALSRDNVELVTSRIERVTESGIKTVDNVHRNSDAIILATGFRATEFLAPTTVRGRDGMLLQQLWADGAYAFLGVAVRGFPNMYLLAGPNSFNPAGSNPTMKEAQSDYILKCLRWQKESNADALEVSALADARYRQWLDQSLAKTVWPRVTSSWYRHPNGRITNPWPATAHRYERTLRSATPEHNFITLYRGRSGASEDRR